MLALFPVEYFSSYFAPGTILRDTADLLATPGIVIVWPLFWFSFDKRLSPIIDILGYFADVAVYSCVLYFMMRVLLGKPGMKKRVEASPPSAGALD